jgi:hypothetical protein
MKILSAVVLLLIAVGAAQAQTVSPIVAEFQAKKDVGPTAEGQIVVRNDGLQPLIATLDPMSFNVTSGEGKQSFYPLDETVSVHFDSSSAKIPPKGEHIFSYRATCKVAPCWYLTFVSMMNLRPKGESSIAVALHIASTTYIYGKTPVRKDEVAFSWQGSDLHVLNNSRECVRGASLEAHFSDGRVQKFKSFPMFPKGYAGEERTFRFSTKPSYVTLKFPKFTLDSRQQ